MASPKDMNAALEDVNLTSEDERKQFKRDTHTGFVIYTNY